MRWLMDSPGTVLCGLASFLNSRGARHFAHSLWRGAPSRKGYRLKKQFRTLMNDTMTNIWDGEWEDSATGRRMKGFGVEVWTMRGKIAVWETAFNSGPADEALDVSQMLK